MGRDYGSGVSRTLSPQDRAFAAVVWQKWKPPCYAELSLIVLVVNLLQKRYVHDSTRKEISKKSLLKA